MNPIIAILAICLPLITGALVVKWISRRTPLPSPLVLSLGYGVGTGILTHTFIFLNYVNITNRFLWVNIVLIGITGLFLWLIKTKLSNAEPLFPKTPFRFDLITTAILFPVGYIALFLLWNGFNSPINSWDTFSTMGLKSKIIYYSQSLELIPYFGKFDYPLHLPSLMAWLAYCGGGWDNTYVTIIFPLYSLSFSVILFYTLRLFTNTRWATIGLGLFFSSAFVICHSTIAYRDITMMYFNCSAILLVLLWHRSGFRTSLLLPALLSGMASFVKLEGFGYLGMHNALVLTILFFANQLSFKDRVKRQLLFSFVSIGIYAIFAVYKKTAILPQVPDWLTDPSHFNLNQVHLVLGADSFKRLWVVLARYVESLFLSGSWNLTWALFIASCLRIYRFADSATFRYLFFFLCMYFSIYYASYSLTQHYHWVSDRYDVMSRSLLHIFPLIPVGIVLLNFKE